MKLLSYRRDGAVRHGWIDETGATPQVSELGDGDLGGFVATILDRAGAEPRNRYPLDQVDPCTPIARPGKLLAVAANYQDHVTETGGEPLDKSRLSPRLFLKPATSIIGPGDPVPMPDVSRQVDWEAELTVVLGRRCRHVAVADALDAVAGYCTSNDVSARSMDYGFERDTDRAAWFFDWLAGKWLDGFAPIGPWLVTADEIPDPQDLAVELTVNGTTRQRGSTKDMIFTVAELIAHASRLMTLEPGDLIMTGTPSGVGAATGSFLSPGDVMSVTVGPLGTLVNEVA
ncbi:fumarylacetoacetate hydrolase family protein [Amycolatopsis sp. CA-230715]|uniref:fumarylacetoacetate hydrolase family protein n=1 Tax=Amycolatopsis sp. CA-230715 TaxID=2745196 RepID=UPI001C032C7F|nr:fumarylacetoacetate hydrolase family protein [Amycolatopsis sp. CA-230715]QWF84947.1 Ureidoglycolate lyase [Amycolatopsis sp. CA-230715]